MLRILLCILTALLVPAAAVANAVSGFASGPVTQSHGPIGGPATCTSPGTADVEAKGSGANASAEVHVSGVCFTVLVAFSEGTCVGSAGDRIACDSDGFRFTLEEDGRFTFDGDTGSRWYHAEGTLARVG